VLLLQLRGAVGGRRLPQPRALHPGLLLLLLRRLPD
jgi:hypothetical protein